MTDTSSPYDRLRSLGIALPPERLPVANFVSETRDGGLMFLSGQGPQEVNGTYHTGKVGGTVTVAQAYQHARLTGINLIGVMHHALGDLSRL